MSDEQTPKKYKARMAIGSTMVIGGFTTIAAAAASNATSTIGGIAVACGFFSVLAGAGVYAWGRIPQWWNHG